jgi:hypothetical protein
MVSRGRGNSIAINGTAQTCGYSSNTLLPTVCSNRKFIADFLRFRVQNFAEESKLQISIQSKGPVGPIHISLALDTTEKLMVDSGTW